MAPDPDSARSSAGNALLPPPPRRAIPPVRPSAPSGPPLRIPDEPGAGAWTAGSAPSGAGPTVPPAAPTFRRRLVPFVAVLATLAIGGGGVYLALRGDDDTDRSADAQSTTTAVPGTFAVDLSTGDDDQTQPTVFLPASTLPLPSISLPLPGAALSSVTTAVVTTHAPDAVIPVGQPPENLGDEAPLDAFAAACYAGDMAACDGLVFAADTGTAYAAYGDTCGGRQPEQTEALCVDVFGPG